MTEMSAANEIASLKAQLQLSKDIAETRNDQAEIHAVQIRSLLGRAELAEGRIERAVLCMEGTRGLDAAGVAALDMALQILKGPSNERAA